MTRKSAIIFVAALAAIGSSLQASGKEVPLELPRPDGRPGSSARPVKVYILSGQSNMVGMGKLKGWVPVYYGCYLTADPNALLGTVKVPGFRWERNYEMRPLGIRKSASGGTPGKAGVAIHKGAYSRTKNYAKSRPARETTVALGVVSASLPTIKGPHTQVVTAAISVPESDEYLVHAGSGESSPCVATLDGKEVYRKNVGGQPALQPVWLKKGEFYPVTITYMKGGSAAFWLERADNNLGGLMRAIRAKKMFTAMLDDKGNWTTRNDVYFQEARFAPEGKGSPLRPGCGYKGLVGPELGFGYVMGEFHDEQVLLIKVAMGNRSLHLDYRPPSSGVTGATDRGKTEGWEYRLMVEGVRKTLSKINRVVPGYRGQGYEIAGFVWWQGHKDQGKPQAEYEKHLVNLIKDLRKEFKSPKMHAVVATVGFDGYRMKGKTMEILKAQMAVGNPSKHPEFAGTVASVDTRDFWRPRSLSPSGAGYHYNHNGETYALVGDALGRAMVRLKGGKAAPRPRTTPEAAAKGKAKSRAISQLPDSARSLMRTMVLESKAAPVPDAKTRAKLEMALGS